MKQPKKLTYKQKVIVSSHRLNADDWMLEKETDFYLYLMARQAQIEMDEVYQVAQAENAENANTVEFIEDKADVVDTTVAEATEEQAEDSTLPPFMQG